ncbi:hypothetical protein Glove_132g131 [Diversispora epigaea]|uniref:Uncharacterized protein n=1 Tax=Diversispora epigaea TaxID=1348612 RepID=A0A397J1F9_9GLOM|nr:hypothetical protein Glove_132g131 [Diversispora epigaea]
MELDEEKEFQWYPKSAKGGNHIGQSYLVYCYLNGIGTTKDDEKAFQFGIGMTKYEEKAFKLYLKSAEGGNNSGQYNF